jgi:hypothetical protein
MEQAVRETPLDSLHSYGAVAPPSLGPNREAAARSSQIYSPSHVLGDPGLEGWFTNENEDGTPLERPAEGKIPSLTPQA